MTAAVVASLAKDLRLSDSILLEGLCTSIAFTEEHRLPGVGDQQFDRVRMPSIGVGFKCDDVFVYNKKSQVKTFLRIQLMKRSEGSG
jgi:hypothetical protein